LVQTFGKAGLIWKHLRQPHPSSSESQVKKFMPVLASAKARDVNESDTVIIVTDMLAEVFGFDKYSEITSEFLIRSTYCDLAVKLGGKVALLLEVKSIGSDLKEAYIKQAVDYAVNQGTEWVVLTNAMRWMVYRVLFTQPIGQELVFELDFSTLDVRSESQLDLLFMLTKEGLTKSRLDDYHSQRQAMSRFFLGAMVLSEPVLAVIRRELRRASPDVKIECDDIANVLRAEVLKREVIEGEKFDDAMRKITKSQGRMLRKLTSEPCGEAPSGAQPAGDNTPAPPAGT
jgi:hypothetical protein